MTLGRAGRRLPNHRARGSATVFVGHALLRPPTFSGPRYARMWREWRLLTMQKSTRLSAIISHTVCSHRVTVVSLRSSAQAYLNARRWIPSLRDRWRFEAAAALPIAIQDPETATIVRHGVSGITLQILRLDTYEPSLRMMCPTPHFLHRPSGRCVH